MTRGIWTACESDWKQSSVLPAQYCYCLLPILVRYARLISVQGIWKRQNVTFPLAEVHQT